MRLLRAEVMRELWSRSQRIVRKGISYRVGRMSYGDYFLEPGLEGRETDGFNVGTIWIKKSKLSYK